MFKKCISKFSTISLFIVISVFSIQESLCSDESMHLRQSIHDMLSYRHHNIRYIHEEIKWSSTWHNLSDWVKTASTTADIIGGSVIGITSYQELDGLDSSTSYGINTIQMVFGTTIAVLKGMDYFLDRKIQRGSSFNENVVKYQEECRSIIEKDLIGERGFRKFEKDEVIITMYSYLNTDRSNISHWIRTGESYFDKK